MDKSANDSLKNFEAGNGDVAITYEYQSSQRDAAGLRDRDRDPAVDGRDPDARCRSSTRTPRSTASRTIANAFVEFLHTPDAADVFYDSVGYERPVDLAKAQAGKGVGRRASRSRTSSPPTTSAAGTRS